MNNNTTTHTRIGVLFFCLFFALCAHAQAPYCLPTYDRNCNAGDGYGTAISQFTLKRGTTTLIDDQTGCNAPSNYVHFTTTTPSVSGGSSYAFDIAFVRPDDGGGAPIPIDAGYMIWIDLNNNNTFENTEIVASGLAAESGTITIPNGTSLGNHRMRIRSNRSAGGGFPSPALPTDPCTLQDMGDTHDYTLNVISCPTITDSTSIRLNVTCVSGTNGAFQFVGKGGTAPYSFTLGKITGNETNTTGLFTGLVAKDYRLTVTDVNGCSGSSVRTIESYTDLSTLNNAMLGYDWLADSIATVGTGVQYDYLTSPNAAFKINGDSLAKYNQGNANAMSKYIPIGFSFKMDNFYYDSLVISEDGVVSFNKNINTTDVSSQWYENTFYTGLNTYTSPNPGDCQCDTAYLNNPLPFIAPFRDDMQTNSSGNVNSKIQYQISGVAPNRVFTVEWRNMRWNRVCNIQRDNSVSFQVELFEGSNNVRFHYKPEPNLKDDNCGGTPLGNFATVTGYNYSAGLFGRRLGGGNYIALNPDSSKLFTNAPNVVTSGGVTTLYRGVKTDNLNFPAAQKYPIGKHYQLTSPATGSCIDPLSIVSVEAGCSSGSDGTITIVATGGLPKLGTPTTDKRYFYSKDGGKTYRLGTMAAVGTVYQDTFKNLAPGTYRIAVQDNQTYQIPGNASPNFQSFIIQTIVVPDARVTTTPTSPTCYGGTNGSIALSWAATSPVGGYQVDFQKVGDALQTSNETTTSKTFTGLSAGTYNVTVTFNDLGCSTSKNIVVNIPTAVDLNATSITQPVCPSNATTGTKTGGFTVTASGGTSPYTFTLPMGLTASSSTATTRTFTGLSAGTYIITVTDVNSCPITESVTLTNPTNYVINLGSTISPTCNSSANGSTMFNVTGGSAATFNSIVFSSSSSPNQTFSSIAKGTSVNPINLAGGNYNVSITEGSCTYNVSSAVSVTAPTNVTFTSGTPTAPTCNGGSNGQLVLVVSGGTPSYMYSIDNGMNYQSSGTFTGLTSGNYTLKAKDANNCFSVTTPTVMVTNPTAITILSIAKNNVLCKGASTGLINVTGSNGTGTYQYSKDGGMTYQSGNQFTGLVAGNYDIKIKDGNNCESAIQIVNISEPATNVSFATSVTNATCAVPTGSIQVTASNGVGVYQFSKDNGTTYTTGTPSNPYTFTGLAINSYQIKVKDGNNCAAAAQTVAVGGSANATITLSNQVNVLCNGGSTGSFRATVSGGSTPYTVVTKNASNTTIAGTGSNPYDYTGLAAGTYTVSVTDGGSCVTTQNVTITQPTAIAYNETSKTNATCGSSNGSITFNITGGGANYSSVVLKLGAATIQNFGAATNGQSLSKSSLAAGTYSADVQTTTGCSASFGFTISGQSTIVINSITPVDATCKGGTGSLTVSASGGTGGLTYSVDGTNFQMSASFPNLTPQAYTVLVKDGNNCTAAQSFTINEPNAVTFTTSKVDVLCNGASTGSITVTASGGTGALQFSKDNGMTYTAGTSPFTFSSLAANTYSIKVKDVNNCLSISSDVEITQPTPLSILSTSQTNVLCNGASTGAVTLLATGGNSSSYTYKKDASTTNTTGTFTGLAAGMYLFTVTDANNCTVTKSVTISESTVLSPSIAGATTVCQNSNPVPNITFTGGGGVAPYTFTYKINGGSDQTITTVMGNAQMLAQSNATAGAFAYTLVKIKDANNCEVSASGSAAITVLALPTATTGCSKRLCPTMPSGTTAVFNLNETALLDCITGGVTGVTVDWFSDAALMMPIPSPSSFTTGTTAVYAKVSLNSLATCYSSASVSLFVNPVITVSTSKSDVTTNGGSNGSILVTGGGGSGMGTLQFSKDGGMTYVSNMTSQYSFTGLTAATYQIRVKDASGCESANTAVQITEPSAVTFTTQVTDAKCNGGNDGSIKVTASNGVAPYEFSKDDGATFTTMAANPYTFTGLSATSYKIKVKDATTTITAATTISVGQPTTPLSISVGSQQNKDCTHPTGSVTLSVSGGTGSLQVSLDGMNFQNGLTFSSLAATTYTATVKDANNCTKTVGFTIADNGTLPPTPNALLNRSICNGEMTTITPSATGVTTFKFYASDPTGGGVTPLSTGASYSYTVSATKTFWITSVNSLCESTPIQTTVTKFDCAKIGDPCLCKNNATTLTNGQFDETVEVTAPVGQTWTVIAVTGLYSTSSLSPPAAPTLISIGTTMTYNVGLARYLLNGIHIDDIGYSVTVSNGMGTTLIISNKCFYPNPSFTLASAFCSNDAAVNLTGSATIGGASATAATGTGSFTIDGNAATAFNPMTLTAASHVVKYTFDAADNVPTAAYPGCIQALSQNVVVNEAPSVLSIIPTAPLCPNGSDGKVDLTVTGGTAVKTFNWNKTGGGFSASTEDITGLLSGTYNVTITNTTLNTCSTTASAIVSNGVDVTPPVITCPTNQVINLPSRVCSATVTFDTATATDNCSTTVSRTDATGVMSGNILRYGTYNFTYKATDGSGNMSAPCTFSIQINQFVPQGGLACFGDVNLSASPTCFTRITPQMLLKSESGCIDNYRVEVSTLGGTILATPVLDATHIGKRFKVSVIDPSGNICWGYLNYEDKTAPEIICPSTASISCADVGSNGAPLSNLTGEPNVFLECSPTTTTYNDQYFDIPCGVILTAAPVGFPVGVPFDVNGAVNAKRIIVRTFTVKDRYNNFSTCQQVIYVNRLKTFTTVCPPPVTVVCAQNTLRTAPTDTTINGVLVQGTGVPTFSNGLPISSNFLCSAAASFTDVQVGNTLVRSWAVATACGDMTMCTQRITVNPSGATCTTLRPIIAGTVRRLNGDNVPTTVVLSSGTDSLDSRTDAVFAFNALMPNQNYTVTPRRPNTDWIKGVTTLDIALVSRHVLGITPFSSPYTIIAADADRDGDVSGVDMLLLQQLILRRRSELPNNNSWRFVSKNYSFLDPTNPLAEPFEEAVTLNNLTTNANADFVAIKTGDVNQSATMLRDGSTGQAEIRGARQPLILPVEDVVLEKNKTYNIPIRLPNNGKAGPSVIGLKNDIQALQFTLNIDKNTADITALTSGNAPDFNDNNLGFFKKEGIVTAAWYRKDNQTPVNNDTLTLFNLTIKANQTTRLSEIMTLNAFYTEGVAYDASGEGMPVQLSFNNQKPATAQAFLLPNRPNPFNYETILSFNLPEAGVAKLTVCDLLGKVVMTTERTFEKGINEVIFNADRTPSLSTGIFIVRLQTASGVAEQKIVLSR